MLVPVLYSKLLHKAAIRIFKVWIEYLFLQMCSFNLSENCVGDPDDKYCNNPTFFTIFKEKCILLCLFRKKVPLVVTDPLALREA